MTSFLLSLAAISVIGSINPNGFAVQIYLLSTPKPVIRALAFTLGEYVGLLISGLLISWGMIQVIQQVLNSVGERIYGLQFFLGIGLLIVGCNAPKFFNPSTKNLHPLSLKPLHTFFLGFLIVAVETPTALPHIAALKQMNDVHLSIQIFILIWALYDLIFIFPLLIMVAVYLVFNENVVSYLEQFYDQINSWISRILPFILSAIGVFFIVNSLIQFFR
ncbi:MAG: GAP family protein [Nostoc sp. NOS(2021)]|uniref:GAP family protein n=1 Tax=Nostoc sp. NOS(2021) TaxID=2815407 RepID=UPI0025DF8CE0|nr:GAP family protein [Nostoc sp. NOS(2021)]MBN3897447.1 GAP family protein [Nostoc sp. NOS(2021)]